MRSLAAPVTTAFGATEVLLVAMLKMAFPSGTIALNSSNYHLVWSGVTYQAAAGLGQITPIDDKPAEVTGLTFELLKVDAAYLGLALDDANQVQGTPITLSTAVLDKTTHQIIDVVTDWVGYADTMAISETGDTCVIAVTAESKAVDLLRSNVLLYNDGDQQSLVPGDRYFEYVVSQSDKPIVWPSREFFYK